MKSVTESKLWYSRKQRRVFKKRLKRRKRAQLREASLAIQEPTIPPQSEDDEVKRAAELQAWIATEAKFQKKFTEKRKKLEDEEKRKPKRNSKDSGQSSVNPCTFFMKTGACRFGVLCRNPHPYPSVSTTLLLKNMFDLPVSGSQAETQDEAEDVDIPEDSLDTMFVTFWQDIIPELHKYGKLKSVLVCRNHSRHLCGSVYVTYHSVEDSRKAFGELQGRFYASRPLQVFYCSISDWSKAICGLFLQNRCGRGKTCNLLHPFQNPDGECQVETEIFHREKNMLDSDDRDRGHHRRHHRERKSSDNYDNDYYYDDDDHHHDRDYNKEESHQSTRRDTKNDKYDYIESDKDTRRDKQQHEENHGDTTERERDGEIDYLREYTGKAMSTERKHMKKAKEQQEIDNERNEEGEYPEPGDRHSEKHKRRSSGGSHRHRHKERSHSRSSKKEKKRKREKSDSEEREPDTQLEKKRPKSDSQITSHIVNKRE